jgi:hypothetical protein
MAAQQASTRRATSSLGLHSPGAEQGLAALVSPCRGSSSPGLHSTRAIVHMPLEKLSFGHASLKTLVLLPGAEDMSTMDPSLGDLCSTDCSSTDSGHSESDGCELDDMMFAFDEEAEARDDTELETVRQLADLFFFEG